MNTMKPFIKRAAMLCAMLVAFINLFAFDFEVDGIYYNKLGSKTVSVTYQSTNGRSYSGDLYIPEKVTYQGTEYTVTEIGECALQYCIDLSFVSIPNTVTTIARMAFQSCSALNTVNIPSSVTTIEELAFSSCASMTHITIPATVTTLGNNVFIECYSMTSFDVDNDNPNYASIDGVLFNKDFSTLICYPIGNPWPEYYIPNSVTTIDENAFLRSQSLTSITIPASVSAIGVCAFARCLGLTKIEVDNNNPYFASIDGVLFDKDITKLIQCPGGKEGNYSLPNTVFTLGVWSFWGCQLLESLIIPESTGYIDTCAFLECIGLKSITSLSQQPPALGSYVFGINKECVLHVPQGALEAYKSADQWNSFQYIDENTAVNNIEVENATSAEVFNLQGMRVGSSTDSLSRGIYIIRRGASVSKLKI